jgi:hypothetical protein
MVGIRNIFWLAVSVVLVMALGYAGWPLSGDVFWRNVFGGLFTLTMALAVGIPVGLSIDRALQKIEGPARADDAEENKAAPEEGKQQTREMTELESRQQQRELAEVQYEQSLAEDRYIQELGEGQLRELLVLLKDELTACRTILEDRIKHPTNLFVKPFKSSFWHTAVSAGKIRSIRSAELLNSLSSVYHQVDTIQRIEEQGYQAAHLVSESQPENTRLTEQLWRDARYFDDSLSRDLEQAVHLIEQELEKGRSKSRVKQA